MIKIVSLVLCLTCSALAQADTQQVIDDSTLIANCLEKAKSDADLSDQLANIETRIADGDYTQEVGDLLKKNMVATAAVSKGLCNVPQEEPLSYCEQTRLKMAQAEANIHRGLTEGTITSETAVAMSMIMGNINISAVFAECND